MLFDHRVMSSTASSPVHLSLAVEAEDVGAVAAPGTPQRIGQIRALRERGWSLDEIALRFGVSRERVRQILRAHGAPDPERVAEARRRRG